VRGFWYYAEYRDEYSAPCDKESAENHPEGKHIPKDITGKECVPQKGNSSKGSKDNDRKGSDLEQRAKDVGGDEGD
jgi:hypothetical protein